MFVFARAFVLSFVLIFVLVLAFVLYSCCQHRDTIGVFEHCNIFRKIIFWSLGRSVAAPKNVRCPSAFGIHEIQNKMKTLTLRNLRRDLAPGRLRDGRPEPLRNNPSLSEPDRAAPNRSDPSRAEPPSRRAEARTRSAWLGLTQFVVVEFDSMQIGWPCNDALNGLMAPHGAKGFQYLPKETQKSSKSGAHKKTKVGQKKKTKVRGNREAGCWGVVFGKVCDSLPAPRATGASPEKTKVGQKKTKVGKKKKTKVGQKKKQKLDK